MTATHTRALLSQALPRRGRFGAAGVADAEQEGAGLVARAGYRPDGIGEGHPAEAIRQFYFDTALAGGMATLTALASVADPGHILFGTDFPMATGIRNSRVRPGSRPHRRGRPRKLKVFRGNAERLFRRVPATAG